VIFVFWKADPAQPVTCGQYVDCDMVQSNWVITSSKGPNNCVVVNSVVLSEGSGTREGSLLRENIVACRHIA